MDKLDADFAYTLDGSDTGTIEDETFSADSVLVKIKGKAEHPGYAYGKLVSALKVAAAFVSHLPKTHLSPETTNGKQGFVHPTRMTGTVEAAEIEFIIRDFVTEGLDEKMKVLENVKGQAHDLYPESEIKLIREEQYRNMKYVIDEHPEVTKYAMEAMEKVGLKVNKASVRGGTDGSRLSHMGLPCPNLFTGQHGIHSRQEWISLQDMERSTATLVELVQIWANKA
jgi:tripeptide aminopeptidase